jgi:uncharacterized protein
MVHLGKTDADQFCWLDLAATDAEKATAFYGNLFGWTSCEQPANDGSVTRLRLRGQDVGSLYQLKSALLAHGIPLHWTPYVRVDDVENAVQRAIGFGGVIVAEPFSVSDVAQIALIEDSVGALVGLWQPIASNKKANGHD